jgi:hypothetical protein
MVGGRLVVGELEPEHIGGSLYAGFLCGAIFSELAGIASGRRRLDEMSFAQAAAWGAAGGLVVGVVPFVLGDNGSYSNAWATSVVAMSCLVAGIAAGRRRLAELSVVRAVALVAVLSGLLVGALPWILGNQTGLERFLPVTVIGGLTALSALSASVSLAVAGRSSRQSPAVSAPGQGRRA